MSFIDYITQPWRNLFWLCFNIYLTLWSGIGSLSMKMLVLPIRIYNAMQKEDMMEIEMQEIQKLYMESEHRVRELEGELEQVLDDCKQYKDLLEDAETQNKAILKKYQLLQLRVLELEDESDHLKAHKERVLKGVHEGESELLQKKDMRNSFHLNGHINGDQLLDKHTQDLTGKIILAHNMLVNNRARYEGRGAALSSSMFSFFLSLLVGAIAWQAQDPCIPLVVAVFMVVCMSLKTVAQFLLSIYNGPGFDAVALLSFNWFILGTLAYPVLPRLAQTVAPIGAKFGHWLLRLMGVNYITEKLRTAFL